MGTLEDPFVALAGVATADADSPLALLDHPLAASSHRAPLAVTLARLHGFDDDEQPPVAGLVQQPGVVVQARTTVTLAHQQIGAQVLLVFEDGNPLLPIITGVVQASARKPPPAPGGVAVEADGERHVITAEREIVLRCGEASITLTRAGRVVIKGRYILSRSSGYNKIKGAAIDIN